MEIFNSIYCVFSRCSFFCQGVTLSKTDRRIDYTLLLSSNATTASPLESVVPTIPRNVECDASSFFSLYCRFLMILFLLSRRYFFPQDRSIYWLQVNTTDCYLQTSQYIHHIWYFLAISCEKICNIADSENWLTFVGSCQAKFD